MSNGQIFDYFRCMYQKVIEEKRKKEFDGRYVAMFHQVDDDINKWYDNRYSISFESFKHYIIQLIESGYEIVSPYEIVKDDKKKKVVLTFDDAFDGIYYCVYPFLKELNIPFVVFPAIDKLDEQGYINMEMLVEMSNDYSRCYIGGHSFSHCNLRKVSKLQSRKEIIESGEQLEKCLKKKIKIFAYPYGSIEAVGKREQRYAKEKYEIAFGTVQTGITKHDSLTYLPRINVNELNVGDVRKLV